jgi:hypothetical protein
MNGSDFSMKPKTITFTEPELTSVLGNEAARRLGLPQGLTVGTSYDLRATKDGKFVSLTVTISDPKPESTTTAPVREYDGENGNPV